MFQRIILSLFMLFPLAVSAQWQKINDVDYVWGPFKIYTLSLYSESGQYQQGERPLMLSLKYAKPVEGRDFAISLARSWSNLGITLPDQENVVDQLKKIMPNIRNNDVLSYIALEERGYFILNDTIIPAEFNQDFNNAVVSVWLDPRVEIGRKLLNQDMAAHHAHKSEVLVKQDGGGIAPPQPVTEEKKQEEIKKTEDDTIPKENGTKGKENGLEPLQTGMDKDETPKMVEYPNPEIEVLPPYDAFIFEPEHIV